MVIGFGDSLLLLFAEYVYASEVLLWYFVEQCGTPLGDVLDGQFDQPVEHIFVVKQCVVPWPY